VAVRSSNGKQSVMVAATGTVTHMHCCCMHLCPSLYNACLEGLEAAVGQQVLCHDHLKPLAAAGRQLRQEGHAKAVPQCPLKPIRRCGMACIVQGSTKAAK
jgi:hypothetical protein